MRLIFRDRLSGQHDWFSVLLKAFFRPLVTITSTFAAIVGSTFVPSLRAPFRTAFMPLVMNFCPALRLRFFTQLRRGFYWFLLLAAITGCLVVCAAVGKTVTSASSAAASSAPLARTFPLLLLRSTFFRRTALC